MVQPLPGEPAALVDCGSERVLAVADYHAGLEVALRDEGVELRSGADDRRSHLLDLVDAERPDRVVVLGDLANAIGRPGDEERGELDALFAALVERAPVTVVKGNHDGELEVIVAELGYGDRVTVAEGPGTRVGTAGFAHGHTWPARAVVEADTVCVAHEHPQVRLEDEVGGVRTERAWLRGWVEPAPFAERVEEPLDAGGELVVFPAFNERVGGTAVNGGDAFLSPYLPAGLRDADAYLLDGTRLGDYRGV